MSQTDTKLRPGFGARVRTNDTVLVGTAFGAIERPAFVTVNGGEPLPDNLADGEYERLKKLGAFDPVPTRAQRGLVEATPQNVLNNTAPPGEAVTTQTDLPTGDTAVAAERLAQAQEDVRKAFDDVEKSAAEDAPLPGEPGTPGAPVSHAPAEGDAVADEKSKSKQRSADNKS